VNAQGDTQLSRCFCSGPGQPSSTRRTARQNEIEDASGCEIATKRVRGPFENPHGPQFLRTRSAEGRAAPTRHRVGTSRGNPFPQFCWRDQPNSCPRNGRHELSVPGRVPRKVVCPPRIPSAKNCVSLAFPQKLCVPQHSPSPSIHQHSLRFPIGRYGWLVSQPSTSARGPLPWHAPCSDRGQGKYRWAKAVKLETWLSIQ
jgi:hypothetical protein